MYGANDEFDSLIEAGVDGIITDYPERLCPSHINSRLIRLLQYQPAFIWRYIDS